MRIVFKANDPEKADPINNTDVDWKLTGTDADDFEINGTTGALMFKTLPDFEAPTDSGRNNGYDVTVQVTDDGGNTVSQRVRITVTNAEEAGTITLSHTQPEVGARLTATLTDPDRARGTIRWQWYRGSVTTKRRWQCGQITMRKGALPMTSSFHPASIDRGGTSATYTPVADNDDRPSCQRPLPS